MFLLLDQLIMRYIFKKWKSLHYLHLMIKDVVEVILKVNPGVFEYVEVLVEIIESFSVT